MNYTPEPSTPTTWLDKPIFESLPKIRVETLIILTILILTMISRFYDLGARVMSHDEINHVIPSYELATGKGYRHDPVTHGPDQFHMMALSYFLFGANDFTARFPAALFSIATVAFAIFGFRRYLGRIGSIVAGFGLMISPYMLFYGRYARNEAFIALYVLITLYFVLRYLEKGSTTSLLCLTAVTALHFTAKSTAYISTAQLLVFLAFLFMDRIARAHWPKETDRRSFLYLSSGALILLLITLGLAGWHAIETRNAPPDPSAGISPIVIAELAGVIIALVLGILAIIILLRSIGWNNLKKERSFELLILIGSLILPLLAAFPIRIISALFGLDWNPLDYTSQGLLRTGIFLVGLTVLSFVIGYLWRPKLWLANFALFYSIFVVLYTTMFTNGFGFFTGIVGGLGYWLDQQAVHRGGQPFYYYALIQIPIYEYLPAFGAILATYFGIRYKKFAAFAGNFIAQNHQPLTTSPDAAEQPPPNREGPTIPEDRAVDGLEPLPTHLKTDSEVEPVFSHKNPLPILAFLLFWSVTTFFAYTLASERMPWLTVHITMPLWLTAGWGFGYLIETTPWSKLKQNTSWLALVLLPVFIISLGGVFRSLLGPQLPFQGNTLDQLQTTTTFIFSVTFAGFSGWGAVRMLRDWRQNDVLRLFVIGLSVFLAIFTARTAFTAAYINYDNAKEFLVYAHAARGPKDVLIQVEEISRRTTQGKNIEVAYDHDANYPFWWYFRDFPNRRYFTDNVTRDMRELPVIIAGESNWGKLESITRGNFVVFEYMRLLWPMQDYFDLTPERIVNALTDPAMRAAIFKIWRDRDYTDYARLTNNPNLTYETWQPSQRMRVYIRKDIIAQIWNYGAAPALPALEVIDPYQQGMVSLIPDRVVGQPGSEPGQLQAPRDMAFAPDGSFYVADSRNHRIQHFSQDGEVLHVWGSFADATNAETPGGTFNEPWGIAVAADGSVFVADTWNHRIQKFSPEGQFIQMWGFFGQDVAPEAFWGPRDLAFDTQGRLFVTDTGNKRIAVFNQDGSFITDFGSHGMDPGQFDEQVGIAINQNNEIFITDTWNQRIQVFSLNPQTGLAEVIRSWEFSGWFGESLENKPYIAVDNMGNVFVTDPEGYRVLQFSEDGQFIRGWGDYSTEIDGFGLPSGVTVDLEGKVWVSDSANNRLMQFTIPLQSEQPLP